MQREGMLARTFVELAIEQAKGIVAEREGIDIDGAVAALRGHARDHNRRLADVARDVVAGRLRSAELRRPRPKRS